MRKTAALAAALLAFTAAACKSPMDEKVPATAVDGNMAYIAGDTIRPGLWYFANAVPHKGHEVCSWSVAEKTEDKGRMNTIASGYDPGNSVQSMYVAPGQYLIVNNCGKGAWMSATPTPGPVAS